MQKKLISLDEFIRKLSNQGQNTPTKQQPAVVRTKSEIFEANSNVYKTPMVKLKSNIPYTFERHSFIKTPGESKAGENLYMDTTARLGQRKTRKRIFSSLKKQFFRAPLKFDELGFGLPSDFKPCTCKGTWDLCLPLQRLLKKHTEPHHQAKFQQLKDSQTGYIPQLRLDLERTNSQVPEFFYPQIETVLSVVLEQLQLEYVQGMNHIAGQLLVHVKVEWRTWLALRIILGQIRPWMEGTHLQGLLDQVHAFGDILRERLPELARHLQVNGIAPQTFMVKWLLSFLGGKVPIEYMAELYGKVIQTGKAYLLKLVLLYLSACQQKLLRMGEEALLLELLRENKDTQLWAKIFLVAKDFKE